VLISLQHPPSLRCSLFAAALAASATCTLLAHASADEAKRDTERARTVRLSLAYPLSGPREIQAADRTTRRYRAVAAHAVPPITEAMARMVADAVSLGGYGEVVRERRTALEMLTRAETDTAKRRRKDELHLVLAGDDVLRAHDLRRHGAEPDWAARLQLIEPIAVMPFVLVCATGRCTTPMIDRSARSLAFQPRAFAAAGEWSTSYLAADMLRRKLNLASLLIPYSGGSNAMIALIAGEADAAFVALPLALLYLGQSKIHALGLASAARFQRLPSLRTLAELGIEGVEVEGWFGLFASLPRGHPAAHAIATSVRAYRLEPASREELLARGLLPSETSVQAFSARVRAERQRWAARIPARSSAR
jgi:hypothetical protein